MSFSVHAFWLSKSQTQKGWIQVLDGNDNCREKEDHINSIKESIFEAAKALDDMVKKVIGGWVFEKFEKEHKSLINSLDRKGVENWDLPYIVSKSVKFLVEYIFVSIFSGLLPIIDPDKIIGTVKNQWNVFHGAMAIRAAYTACVILLTGITTIITGMAKKSKIITGIGIFITFIAIIIMLLAFAGLNEKIS